MIGEIRKELHASVIGQEKVVDALIRSILADGHALIEGVPGLAKTVLVKTLSQVLSCDFKRVQFTIDLLPSDIIGVNSFDQNKGYHVIKGPIFTNLLLADEINRASPKVQSALLEAMGEGQVTVGKESIPLPHPFFVFATQNPLESLGTYPLPQAQLDRFLFKIMIHYPEIDNEVKILDRKEGIHVNSIIGKDEIVRMQQEVQQVHVSQEIKKYIVHITNATRTPDKYGIESGQYIETGCGPRATISLLRAAKAEAYMNHREFITPHDVKQVAFDVLRHRLMVNYLGQAKNIKSDQVIQEILTRVPIP